MSIWETDRTSILTYQACPRKYWWTRRFNGTGIDRKQKSLPLVFGGAFHEGVGFLLQNPDCVDAAVEQAREYIAHAYALHSVDLEGDKQIEYAINEQKAIAEGLLRAWWATNGERFLREFEILEVEAEGRANLSDDITLLFRPDALVRERSTGDIYVISWKTASTFGAYTVNSMNSDMQSISEVWGVLNQDMGTEIGSVANIEGVLYITAVKGQWKKDDYLGFKVQNTPLAYGWLRKGATDDMDEWAHQYGWQTEEINSKTGKPVSTKLGKGFRKVSIWDNYEGGVKAWIDDLANNRIEPRHINALEQIFPQTLPVSRRKDEIDSWRVQVVAQEERVRNSVRLMELAVETGGDVKGQMDKSFPQYTHSCFAYNSKCGCFDLCWNPAVAADPLGSGLYQIRQANHPEKGNEDE